MLLPDHVPSCDSAPGQQETGAGAAGSGEDGERARRRRRKEERVKGQGAGIGEPGVEPGRGELKACVGINAPTTVLGILTTRVQTI